MGGQISVSIQERQMIGAQYLGDGRCCFRVWSPLAREVEVHLLEPKERFLPMKMEERGYFLAFGENVKPGALYVYRLDRQKERPDPASHFQPQGIHGPSQVIDPHFSWGDSSWSGISLANYLIYELHVGTFTLEGTFPAIGPYLEELKNLGITAIEVMPIAQFPGSRNWGYDGVYPFAVQNSYGGPEGFKQLVNACHQKGLAVILDLVYNHLGPEGNYLRDFGFYFTDRYKTPWGEAINFDGPHSDEVRNFFIANALYWIREFHMDALRIDAVHAIMDFSAEPFLKELAQAVHRTAAEQNRQVYVIAESDLNDTRLVQSRERGGFGLDAQWSDDFHHALHTLLTGEQQGYYQDFGDLQHLVKAFREGFVYAGEYSPFRKRRQGNSSRKIPADRFIVFSQNHDQVGNRMLGERLSSLVSFEGLKLAAGLVLLSPLIPLLFMGEEYGEKAPFQYFINHLDPNLVEAVRRGRKEEFSSFAWQSEPPDPQDMATFLRSKLNHSLRSEKPNRFLLALYRELIRLRKTLPPLASLSKEEMEVAGFEKEGVLWIRRWKREEQVFMAFNFSQSLTAVPLPLPSGYWEKMLDSEDERWGGKGSSIPQKTFSAGEVKLPLNAQAFILGRKMETT
jgi:maltooligosyltrehalose trehalohydrolase